MKSLKTGVIALISGLLFGLGLLLSGMNNPAKVRAFLDVLGDWKPELIAVMGAAVVTFAIAFWLSGRLQRPFDGGEFHPPKLTVIDFRLLGGAVLFGVGWGLVGLCPGPALVDLLSFDPMIIWFVLALITGNRIAHYLVGPVRS